MKYGAIIATLFLLLAPIAQAGTYQVVIDGVEGWAATDEVAPNTFDTAIELEDGTHLQFVNSEAGPARVSLRRPSAETAEELSTLLITNPLTPDQERQVIASNADLYDMLIWYRVPVGIDGHPMKTDCTIEDCVDGAAVTCGLFGGLRKLDYQTGDHCRYECNDGSKGSVECEKVTAKPDDALETQRTGGNGN